jgi:thioredoxin 1
MVGNPVGGILFGALIGALLASSFAGREPDFTPSQHVTEIADGQQLDLAIKSSQVVLVDFYANWCGPCRRLKPIIHQLADRYAGRVAVLAVNVDKHGEISGRYGVSGIPDVRIFKDGSQVEKIVGLSAAERYSAAVAALLPAQ